MTDNLKISGNLEVAELQDVPETSFGWKRILDHGFVALMRIDGSEQDICNAARVSLKSGESYNDVRTRTDSDNQGLINYLLSHGHTSPFEMAGLVFVVQAPIFVARQWFRHRTWSYNEISGRYTELPATQMYVPGREHIHHKSNSIKQGRGSPCSDKDRETYLTGIEDGYHIAKNWYDIFTTEYGEESRIRGATGLNISREIARIGLPVGTYTRFYAKVDMNNFLKFLGLRSKPNAQWEIQEYSNAMWDLAKPHFPHTFKAWENHVFYGARFSRKELLTLESLFSTIDPEDTIRLNKKQLKLIDKLNKCLRP